MVRAAVDATSSPQAEEAAEAPEAAEAAEAAGLPEQPEEHGAPEGLWFCAFVGLSVFANVQVVALETDYGCAAFDCTIEQRLPWYVFDHLFTVLFVADVIGTMAHTGPVKYFRGEPALDTLGFNAFNCADFCIVFARVVDVWGLGLAGIQTGLKLVSLLRVIHITRFVKRMRLISAFRELWLVVAGMKDTIKVVAWVAVLLVLLLWVFATLVTIAVGRGDSSEFDFRQSTWTKDEYWGNVPRSMYSLFQVFTGDKWSDSLAWPLIKRYPLLVILFVAFRVAAILALMNTIVGVIVETTLSSARANEATRARDNQRKDAMVMESLHEIFRQADTNNSKTVDRKELAAMIRTPEVRDRMQMLEIPVRQLELLHGLLDQDGSGNVDTDAFFRGCSRLRGPAMALDLHQMSVDLDRHVSAADAHIARAGEANDALAELLDRVELVDVEIVKGDADERDPVLLARRERSRPARGTVLRSANWLDDSPPPFLVQDGARSRQSSKASAARPSLVRGGLRASAEDGRGGLPGAYVQPAVRPPPPPLPAAGAGAGAAAAGGRSASRSRPGRKSFQGQKNFQWPT